MEKLEQEVYSVIRVLEAQPTPLPNDTEGTYFQYAPVPYRDAARTCANDLDAEDLRRMIPLFDVRQPPPHDYRPDEAAKISRDFAWSVQRHTTLAEILYQARSKAVPALREHALGENRRNGSVSEAVALELYARLAAEGVETEQFLRDVQEAFAALDTEARISVAEAVSGAKWHARNDPARVAAFESLESLPGYQEALEARRTSDE